MKNHEILIVLLTISLSTTNSHDTRPNILLIIVDDLRPVLGAYGDSKAHTPNIDLFASQGVVFERAYAQQALCAPSRNSLLTSRRPDTIGLYDFYSYWRKVAGNFTTLPQHLKNNGYITSTFGKVFHPGKSCNYSDDSPYSWSVSPFHPYTERFKEAPVCSQHNSTPATNLICPVRVAEMPNATLPDIETLKAAKKFLHKLKQRPFFVAVGFQKPHVPLKYPKRYQKYHPIDKFSLPDNYEWPKNVSNVAYNPWTDLRRREDVQKLGLKCPWEKIPEQFAKRIMQSYYAAVTYVDDLIGELLRELEILSIRNDTIVILTSDHGWSLGEHAVWSKYSNFEVAVRVPLIISLPARSKLIVREPVELLDLFPTIAELAGYPISACPTRKKSNAKTLPDLCSEGTSLMPLIDDLILSETLLSTDRTAISQYPRPGMEPVCQPSSDKPRLRRITVMGYSLRTIRYRYTAWVDFSHETKTPDWQRLQAEELYDHDRDPAEMINMANSINFQVIKNTLKLKLMERLDRGQD